MKVIIIGSGFIGTHIVNYLCTESEKTDIKCITRKAPKDIFEHPLLANIAAKDKIKVIQKSPFDLTSEDLKINDSLPDVIVYTYAVTSVPFAAANPEYAFQQNVYSLFRVSELLRRSNFKSKFIHISSESVYGFQQKLPISENALLRPINWYAVTKANQELIVKYMQEMSGIRTVIIRSGSVFGPYGRTDQAIPIFCSQALRNEPITLDGDGTQTRDFNYITNLLDAVNLIIEKDTCDGEIINIASGQEITLYELCTNIISLCKSKSSISYRPSRKGESGLRVVLDISKAERLLRYKPTVDLSTGLANTINWLSNRN